MRILIATDENPQVIKNLKTEIDESCTEDLLERIIEVYDYPIQGPARSPELQTQIIEFMIEHSINEVDGRCVLDIDMGPHEYWSRPDVEVLLQASIHAGGMFVGLGSMEPGQDALTFDNETQSSYQKIEMIPATGMPPFTGIARISTLGAGSELARIVDAVDIEDFAIMEEANTRLVDVIMSRNQIRAQQSPPMNDGLSMG